jgi:hypothetical protein
MPGIRLFNCCILALKCPSSSVLIYLIEGGLLSDRITNLLEVACFFIPVSFLNVLTPSLGIN